MSTFRVGDFNNESYVKPWMHMDQLGDGRGCGLGTGNNGYGMRSDRSAAANIVGLVKFESTLENIIMRIAAHPLFEWR